jgi:hypothetical protein
MERLLGAWQAVSRRAPGLAFLVAQMAAAFTWTVTASASIETYGTEILRYQREGDKAGLAQATRAAEQNYRESPTLEHTNDLAVAWILSGRVSEGIQLLRDLEHRSPGNAIVASNLGTALELAGNEEEALNWLRESVRRDPQEHQGSEWVHVKILEARLALKRDPNWLRKNSVIGWREGQRLPLDERSQPRTPRKLVESINYQLEERLQLIDGPDPIVADLYLTLGDLAFSAAPGAYANAPERDAAASAAYGRAIQFGTVHETRARERKQAADQRIEAARPALLAARKREQEVRARALENERTADERRRDLESAQRWRRLMPVIAFGAFGLLVAGVLIWYRRRASAESIRKP